MLKFLFNKFIKIKRIAKEIISLKNNYTNRQSWLKSADKNVNKNRYIINKHLITTLLIIKINILRIFITNGLILINKTFFK